MVMVVDGKENEGENKAWLRCTSLASPSLVDSAFFLVIAFLSQLLLLTLLMRHRNTHKRGYRAFGIAATNGLYSPSQ
jgi:hypothetical protein